MRTHTSVDAVTCGPIRSSHKACHEVTHPGHADHGEATILSVPVRRIDLTNDTTFDVYDTSGPYTGYADSAACHDLGAGLLAGALLLLTGAGLLAVRRRTGEG